MSVIVILILASLGLALAFLAGFVWAVKSGQFEDTCTPSMRVLTEDQIPLAAHRGAGAQSSSSARMQPELRAEPELCAPRAEPSHQPNH